MAKQKEINPKGGKGSSGSGSNKHAVSESKVKKYLPIAIGLVVLVAVLVAI